MNKAKEFLNKIRNGIKTIFAKINWKKETTNNSASTDQELGQKKNIFLRVGIIAGVLLVCIGGGIIYSNNKVFLEYETIKSEEKNDTAATQYVKFKDHILKYSADGAVYLSDKQKELWNITYNMPDPMVDICKEAFAISAQRGNTILIFDENGKIGEVSTELPILSIRIANQGVVMAILENGNETTINFYDTKGSIISDIKASIPKTGYPLSMALSEDGVKLMVSYLGISGDTVDGNLAVYNFGTVGQTYDNYLVNSFNYGNEIVPQVEFLNSKTAVAIEEHGFSIYEGKETMELKAKVSFDEDEIVSVWMNSSYLGFIFQGEDQDKPYLMKIYDINGKEILSQEIDTEYQDVKFEDNDVVFLNDKEVTIYDLKGTKKFYASFEEEVVDIFKTNGFRTYTVIQKERIDEVRLK
ncbi:MAG TPA: hypothetical protein IAC41_03130 [Candidatus Merdenecus merdavium]|nr:hypothetical protein [Candidatus Merdenecus merdavium]